MENEVWKPVVGYEWLYEVSSRGSVKSLFYRRTKDEAILSQNITRLWYANIKLKWHKNLFVHRLVWASFLWLDLNDRKQCVLHKDDNPLNNTVDNLFIGNHSDNMKDMTNKWRNKYPNNSKKILQFGKENLLIKKWDSLQQAENELWIYKSSISQCCNWKRKTAGGFVWKYFN